MFALGLHKPLCTPASYRPVPVLISTNPTWRCAASSTRSERKQTKHGRSGVIKEAKGNIKENPRRRGGKKIVREEGDGSNESTTAELTYGGAISVRALEPREEYSSEDSVPRLKDLRQQKKLADSQTQVSIELT